MTNARGAQIPGVDSVHELHVWRLNEQKAIASVHVVVSSESVFIFTETARHINECLHAYGIHSTTLQPELPIRSRLSGQDSNSGSPLLLGESVSGGQAGRTGRIRGEGAHNIRHDCQLVCARTCEGLMCCEVTQAAAE